MNDARLSEGREISVRGTVESWKGYLQMNHPEWCVAESFHPGFHPIYAALAGLGGKRIATMIRAVLNQMPASATSPLDDLLLQGSHLPPLRQALQQIHAPDEMEGKLQQASETRLKSEEIIVYLHLMREKKRSADTPAPLLEDETACRKLLNSFPFPLTETEAVEQLSVSADRCAGKCVG